MSRMFDAMTHTEKVAGAAMTYSAAGFATFAGWLTEVNWLAVLSAIAVLIRIGIDLPRLIAAIKTCRRKRRK